MHARSLGKQHMRPPTRQLLPEMLSVRMQPGGAEPDPQHAAGRQDAVQLGQDLLRSGHMLDDI
ncbi:MAG: hypothetical protein ACI8PT_000726 [Gammaproteobacteria bacterium]|jgi:hypothetical protein